MRDPVYELPGHVQLAKSQLEVVPVIQHVEKVGIEGVNVVHLRKIFKNCGELVMPVALCVLHLHSSGQRRRISQAPVSRSQHKQA